jgi:hypothetical protein
MKIYFDSMSAVSFTTSYEPTNVDPPSTTLLIIFFNVLGRGGKRMTTTTAVCTSSR